MTQSVRVEFVRIGSGSISTNNILKGPPPSSAQTISVTTTATAGSSRPQVPSDTSDGSNGAVRLTAFENAVYVTWGADPTATLSNSLILMPGVPEVIFVPDGQKLSFISAT